MNDKTIIIDDKNIKYTQENVIKNKTGSLDVIPSKSLKNAIKPVL